MFTLPRMQLIKNKEDLEVFAKTYNSIAGFDVPFSFFENNKIFRILVNGEMVGGFALGQGPTFRSISVFAKEEKQDLLYELMEDPMSFTDLNCFWIARKVQTNTLINLFIWVSLSLALKFHAKKYILFGTHSKSLARLYSQTKKSVLFHQDRIDRKNTYIFVAQRRTCIRGILEIVGTKIKRTLQLKFGQAGPQHIPQLQRVKSRPVSNIFK